MSTLVTIDGKEYTAEELITLSKAGVLSTGAKHDTSSATPSATPPHGPWPGSNTQFGIFSTPGVRPGVWNATPRLRGIGDYIPMFKSTIMNELIEVATGVTVGTGTNQTSACVVGPKPGQLKAAQIAATFGIIHMSTKIFDVTQAGMRRNRSDVDREMYNGLRTQNRWLPEVTQETPSRVFNSALYSELLAMGINLERSINQVHFVGVAGTEDNTYLGVARQWNGLDALIKTGWVDNVSGAAAPALDATITNFNANVSGGTDAFGRGIVAATVDEYYSLTDRMSALGIVPEYAVVGRADALRALANSWACSYGTDRCYNAAAGTPITRSSDQVQRNFEEIMANRYLPMDGVNVPFIIDDAIPRQTLGNNYYQSDLYFVMLRGNGIPTLFGEYFDMNNAEAMEIVNFGGMADDTTTFNDGLYRMFKRVTGGCREYDFYARPRLITTTPFAHGRVDNIFYRADFRMTDPIPGQSAYVNGGNTVRY